MWKDQSSTRDRALHTSSPSPRLAEMKSKVTLTTIALLTALPGASAAFPGAAGSKKVARAVKSDVKYIECEVCEFLSRAATEEYDALKTEQGKKLTETDVIEKMEKMCQSNAKEGDWIITKDLQEKGSKLRVVDMGKENYGECGAECKTIVAVCEKILGPRDTDVGEFLYTWKGSGDLAKALQKWLCEEETDACAKAAPPLPKSRPKGEKFKKRDKKDVDMERLMAGMQGMPGMGGAQMFSRDQMMAGMGGDDDDMDDMDDSPSPPSEAADRASLMKAVKAKFGKAENYAKQATESVKGSVKGAWEKTKNLLGMGEEEDVESQFSQEELAKEEL
jgi:hypothetical protein|tara:strand:+ start:37 stop:1038 length:1002 start_codon:yes stop_codon:yes gene_type:complete